MQTTFNLLFIQKATQKHNKRNWKMGDFQSSDSLRFHANPAGFHEVLILNIFLCMWRCPPNFIKSRPQSGTFRNVATQFSRATSGPTWDFGLGTPSFNRVTAALYHVFIVLRPELGPRRGDSPRQSGSPHNHISRSRRKKARPPDSGWRPFE